MTQPNGCAEVADLLVEFATGSASGPERARLLRHLNSCHDCRRELEELTRIADEVLLMAPEREPPAGFESAVLARMAAFPSPGPSAGPLADPSRDPAPVPARPRRRWRWLRPAVAVAGAAAFAIGGAGAAWQATADDREIAAAYRETLEVANGRYFSASDLENAAGEPVGTVFFYEGSPSWLYLVVRDAPPGTYDVAVRAGGRATSVAECEVTRNSCDAGATLDVPIYSITDVRLVAPDGTTLRMGG